MQGKIPRHVLPILSHKLASFPAVAVLGPRQCGKTTLAQEIVKNRKGALYLDLERPSDLRKLDDPELYFQTLRAEQPGRLICLDEIQRVPELFAVLRSVIDEQDRNGQFLLLGSASRDLLRQTSESLAGRINFLELTPLLASEVADSDPMTWNRHWVRGGYPRSFLAESDQDSLDWRTSFVRTFLERDLPQLGFGAPSEMIRRLWRMLAHHHGQLLNQSQIGSALGVSHTTVRSYIDLLGQTFMVRSLEPLEVNIKKRLVKSPKVYLRDTGILHSLLEIADGEELLGHPSRGESWEGLVIENVIAARPDWQPSFYRTAAGAEMDLILSRGQRRIAIECKASTAPAVSRGFWSAIEDVQPTEAWVIAPVSEPYPIREGVTVSSLEGFLARES